MMQPVELEIHLEKTDRIYSSDQKITGKVNVTVREDWPCEGLVIILGAKGLAKTKDGFATINMSFTEDRVKKPLHQGPWSSGQYEYPFEIEIPDNTFSYKGSMIELAGYLKAEARPPKGELISAETETVIVPAEATPEKRNETTTKEVIHRESSQNSIGCLLFCLVLFISGTTAAVILYRAERDNLLGFAIFLAVVGLGLLIFTVYTIMVNKRVNLAEARIASGTAFPGDVVPCSLLFQVSKSTGLKDVTATLTCREEAGNVGIRASKKTYRQDLYEKKYAFRLPAKEIPAGVPVNVRGEIAIPPDAPPSFTMENFGGQGIRLKWVIEFRIEINNWPDWFCIKEIIVKP